MLEIFVFSFGLMYTPGPVNMLMLFTGIRGDVTAAIKFCVGVATAMFCMFMGVGYVGSAFIPAPLQNLIGILGAGYILYLAYKMMKASFSQSLGSGNIGPSLNFGSGFLMQVSNPKAPIVILPVATVHFPAANIQGVEIALMSIALGIFAFGAPGSYLFAGYQLKQAVLRPNVMKWLNRIMAIVLLYIACQLFMGVFVNLSI